MNEATRLARPTDPPTSRAAADDQLNSLSTRRRQVLKAVFANPGATAGELGMALVNSGELPPTVALETPHKRLPELEDLGLVYRSGTTADRYTGKESYRWYPVD